MISLKHISALLACFMLFPTGHAVQIRRQPGQGIPEYALPTDRDNPALWTSKPNSFFTRSANPGAYAVTDVPRMGTIEYPLVLVDFDDLHFSIQDNRKLLERYELMFNAHGYSDSSTFTVHETEYHGATGSVSDYFRDQSYGQFIPKFKIIGPVRVSKGYAYYGKGKADNVDALVREVCDSIITNNLINLSGYARNGTVDQLSIIYAGRGENYNGSDINTIWPQASIVSFTPKDSAVYRSGIKDVKYACTCELFWDTDTILDGIGTFCHEFSHTLGLPDFYNTDSQSESEVNAAMGYWSIMDYGNYEDGGFSPVGYTAFEKYSLGWMDLEEIKYAGTYSLSDISRTSDPENDIHTAYRLNTGNDDQFIILENHIKTGWYKYHASEGLMVTAVDYDEDSWAKSNKVNTSQKRYQILAADNNYARTTNSQDLFPLGDTDSITTLGTPKLKAGSSYPPYSIYRIRKNAGKISFCAAPDMASKVQHTTKEEISINLTDGELSVSAPIGSNVSVHELSGKTVLQTVTTQPAQRIALPDRGIWIVKCGDTVRKIAQ